MRSRGALCTGCSVNGHSPLCAQDKSKFLIKADIPGVNKEDIKVTTEGDTLSLSVEKTEEKKEEDPETKFHRYAPLPVQTLGRRISCACGYIKYCSDDVKLTRPLSSLTDSSARPPLSLDLYACPRMQTWQPSRRTTRMVCSALRSPSMTRRRLRPAELPSTRVFGLQQTGWHCSHAQLST